MKKVLITGATGLVGQQLVKQLIADGFAVNYLTTRASAIHNDGNIKGFKWNPSQGQIDIRCFDGVSIIINLAGASIARRWTASNKEDIIKSRTDSIKLLFETVKNNDLKIQQFITASAIGYYPYSETRLYDEGFKTDMDSFIINVVRAWEKSADAFKDINIPVTKVRIGIVLASNGGVLDQLVKPIKNYFGAVLGSGDQWQSWIHIDDLAGIFLFLLDNKKEGVFNAVSPNPVSHKVMTKQIASVLNKPLILPSVPTFVLKLTLGKMHELVTKGQRVSSKKIEDQGFEFQYFQLGNALEDLLK